MSFSDVVKESSFKNTSNKFGLLKNILLTTHGLDFSLKLSASISKFGTDFIRELKLLAHLKLFIFALKFSKISPLLKKNGLIITSELLSRAIVYTLSNLIGTIITLTLLFKLDSCLKI